MRLKRIVLFLVLSLLLCEISFLYGHENLRNIGSEFVVLIGRADENGKKIGLTKNRLRIVSELRLRKEGMKVVAEKDASPIKIPNIHVSVHVVGTAFHVELRVIEWVGLMRLPTAIGGPAFTWEQGITGTHGGDPEFIVSNLNKLFDDFLNDYYKANPKEKKETMLGKEIKIKSKD